ncbi:MAG: hypothetical protein LAP39_28310 [Acidobacteriia bacterium]|nr:hypothetical protein [Terriglobia bacterium]
MKKTISVTSDPKQAERLRRIEAELGPEMLEKLLDAFNLLSAAMVHRAARKAKAQLQEQQTT